MRARGECARGCTPVVKTPPHPLDLIAAAPPLVAKLARVQVGEAASFEPINDLARCLAGDPESYAEAADRDRPAPAQEAWQTVCYYVYEPMWTDRGWQLVYAKRCINHLALAPGDGRRGNTVA